jgi:tRNA 2-thiouridine synthesizing protein A
MVDTPTPDQTLDTKGLLCPMPIVRLSKAMRDLLPHQIILMEATDPGAIPDVAAWSKNTGNPILAQETVDKVMRFWIQKA